MEVAEFSVNDSADSIVYGIVSELPDVIGFSVYIWNVKIIGMLIADIRKMLPDSIIVLGGPEVSYGVDGKIFSEKNYDYIVSGEGEYSLYCLLAEIFASKNSSVFSASPEFCYRKSDDGVTVYADNCSLDGLPFIYNEDNLPKFENRIIYYETSRGCPFNCAYCLSGAESKVRFLNIERVFKEIDFFNKNKVPQVKFVDRTFNCNPKRAKQIVKYISALEDCETNFHFEVGADLFDDEFIDILSEVPCGRVQIEAGIQSMQHDVLEACCRKTDVDKCFSNLKKIISMGNINVHTDLIAGLPFETAGMFVDSFNKTYALRSHQLQLGFLKLLKGAPLNGMLEEHSYMFSSNPPYEIISNKYISHKEILRLKEVEDALDRFYNSGHYVLTLELIEKHFGTPFELYRKLADRLIELKMIFKPVSLRQGFDIMYSFAESFIRDGEELKILKKIMLTDYFSSNKSDMPPDSLRDIWKPERSLSGRSGDIMKLCGIDDFRAHRLRIIDDEIYIFDVSKENPVTGRYSYKKVN